MKRITLICMGGFSTSMLMKKMKTSAQANGIEVTIEATSESNFKKFEDITDILLIGPQVSFIEEDMKKKYPNIKVAVIKSSDYGTMNGEKVLKDALEL